MMIKNEHVIDQIIKLKNENKSYRNISKELSIPYSSVRRYYIKYVNSEYISEKKEKNRIRMQKRRKEDILWRSKDCLCRNKNRAIKRNYIPCNGTIDDLVQSYTGFCSICGIEENSLPKNLAMDHCHSTGKFRGWLCDSCNQGLGHFKDSIKIIEKALNYLN